MGSKLAQACLPKRLCSCLSHLAVRNSWVCSSCFKVDNHVLNFGASSAECMAASLLAAHLHWHQDWDVPVIEHSTWHLNIGDICLSVCILNSSCSPGRKLWLQQSIWCLPSCRIAKTQRDNRLCVMMCVTLHTLMAHLSCLSITTHWCVLPTSALNFSFDKAPEGTHLSSSNYADTALRNGPECLHLF